MAPPSHSAMSLCSEENALQDNICPISLECGLTVHRRSIDVSRSSPLDLHGVSAAACRRSSGAPPAAPPAAVPPEFHRSRSGTAPAGPFSTPTPAEYLTADGRLDVSCMMEPQHAQASNHSMRMGSFRFSRAASGRVSNDGSCKGAACAAALPSLLPCSSPRAAKAGDAPQLSEQTQLLGAACRMRDAKSLQQILAAGTLPVSAALDSHANTALHLLLQPLWGPAAGLPQHAAGGPAAGADGSAVLCSHQQHQGSSSSTTSSNRGPFGWLTACFGASSSSSHAASSSLSRGSLGGSASQHTMSPAAAASAQLAMVTALLAAGANVNTRNQDGLTPVMLAAQQVASTCMYSSSSLAASTLKVLETLCKSPTAEVDLKDAAGRTALVHVLLATADTAAAALGSSFKGSQPSAAAAVAAGGSGPCCESSSANGAAVPAGAAAQNPPAPSAAAAAALVKAVQLMLHFRADLNAQDSAGMTPLMHAAAQPGVPKELLQKMLELGANPRLLDNKRRSALTHAMMAQQLQLRPAIGAPFEKYRSSNGRSTAAPAGHAAAAPVSCSSSGCIPTAPDTVINNSSSSIPASLQGSCEAACDVHNSSSSSNASINRDVKAQLRYTNPFPLPSHGSVIRALCSYGSIDLHPGSINTRFPAINSYSQLHIAMRRGDLRALELLVASGADVNVLDAWGNSPLMYWPVAPSEPEEVVQGLVGALLAQGGDPNLPNNDGWQPLDLACDLSKFGKVLVKPECVPVHALLVGYGAKNSEAFITQQRHQPTLLCLRTDSANSVLRSNKSFDSLRVGNPPSLSNHPALPTAVMEEDSQHRQGA